MSTSSPGPWAHALSVLKEYQLALLGLFLAVGLWGAAWMGAIAFDQAKRYPYEVITVTGVAAKPITSDFAEWTCRFARRASSPAAAFKALQGDRAVIVAYLHSIGITQAELETSPVSTTTLFKQNADGDTTNQIEGYELSQSLTARAADVAKIDRAARESTSLMARDMVVDSQSPSFYYTRLDDLKVEMLGVATKNASQRARSMAQSTGRSIGRLRTANMGVFQITPTHSTDVSDYGVNDTSSREKKVTAVVNATFELAH